MNDYSVEKQLRKYIVPNIFAMLGISCYILADTFFISCAAGANGITALNLTLPIYSLIYAFGSMLGMGFATRYMLMREDTDDSSGKMFSYAVEWEILLSLPFILAGMFCPGAVLQLMGADEEILVTGVTYLRIALLFAPCFMLNFTFTAFVRNDHAPKLAMAATLLSSLFNIVFDYIFMFPCGMGMRGAALATGLSPVVSMLICMVHFLSANNTIRFRLVRPAFFPLIRACRTGISYFIGEMASGLTTAAFNYILLGLIGNVAVAAYGVVANFALVATSVFNGISQGQQPVLSELYAQSNWNGVKRAERHSLQISLGAAIALLACVLVFANEMAELFNSDHSAVLARYATQGLRIYFTGFLFAAVNIVRAGYFSAIDAPWKSFVISMSRGVVSIVAFAFLLSRLWGIYGVWLSFPVAELFTLLISGRFSRGE